MKLSSTVVVLAFLAPGSALAEDVDSPPPTLKPFSPELRTAGIVTTTIGGTAILAAGVTGCFAAFASWGALFGDTTTMRSYEYATLTLLAAGGALVAFGVPSIVIGNHKAARVTPTLSPVGGGFRVTF